MVVLAQPQVVAEEEGAVDGQDHDPVLLGVTEAPRLTLPYDDLIHGQFLDLGPDPGIATRCYEERKCFG